MANFGMVVDQPVPIPCDPFTSSLRRAQGGGVCVCVCVRDGDKRSVGGGGGGGGGMLMERDGGWMEGGIRAHNQVASATKANKPRRDLAVHIIPARLGNSS